MDRKVILIHPLDPSTNFLEEITLFLQNIVKVEIIRPAFDFNKGKLLETINQYYKGGDLLLFLGHGSSRSLYGGTDEKENRSILFAFDEVQNLIANKLAILLSCRSSELLFRLKSSPGCIAFGNIPTSIEEIWADREYNDPNYLKGISHDTLNEFRKILVEATIKSLDGYWRKNDESLKTYYLAFRFRLNVALNRTAIRSDLSLLQRQLLFKIIQQIKNEVVFHLNP